MENRKDVKRPVNQDPQAEEQQRINRREAMKRIAKGVAMVGSLGLTAAVVQGQGGCGYVNYYTNSYYNYSNNFEYDNYNDYQNFNFNDEDHGDGDRDQDDRHHDEDEDHHR